MLKGFANVVSRYLFLVLAASLLAPIFNSDPSLKQAESTILSVPQSVLLQTLQTKYAAVRPQRLNQHDSHPMDVHPAVEIANFTPNYVKAARFSFTGKSNPGSANVGWQARAPPFSVMPANS